MDVKENELAARVLEVELEEMLLMAYISAKMGHAALMICSSRI